MKNTHRKEERKQENRELLPVIIRRNDEFRRHPDDMLEFAIEEGLEQLQRPVISLLLSALAAGLILGFSSLAVASMTQLVAETDADAFRRIAAALVYPLGFIICIMSGTQLFTEHTATAVYPVLDRRASLLRLFRLWCIVLIGNLLGALLSAWLLTLANDVIGAQTGYLLVAEHLMHFPFETLLVSSILAGWLMAQGAWLVLATPPASAQILCIYIVTFTIGLAGFHHSIAGAVELMTAVLLTEKYGWGDVLWFIPIVVLGNTIGGSVFVAILNYAHLRHTHDTE